MLLMELSTNKMYQLHHLVHVIVICLLFDKGTFSILFVVLRQIFKFAIYILMELEIYLNETI